MNSRTALTMQKQEEIINDSYFHDVEESSTVDVAIPPETDYHTDKDVDDDDVGIVEIQAILGKQEIAQSVHEIIKNTEQRGTFTTCATLKQKVKINHYMLKMEKVYSQYEFSETVYDQSEKRKFTTLRKIWCKLCYLRTQDMKLRHTVILFTSILVNKLPWYFDTL